MTSFSGDVAGGRRRAGETPERRPARAADDQSAAPIISGLMSRWTDDLSRIRSSNGGRCRCYPYSKEKAEGMVLKVTKMVEPLIIMFMGSSIAGLMLAIYMPMFEMAGKVK
jgi:hypothetical protein